MSWDAKDVALLKKLWAVGQSAAKIARNTNKAMMAAKDARAPITLHARRWLTA